MKLFRSTSLFLFALYWIALPVPAKASLQCLEIFHVQYSVALHDQFTQEIIQFRDQHSFHSPRHLARIDVIRWYKNRLQAFINTAKNPDELEAVYLTLEKTGIVDEQYQDAWRQIDFLQPLRQKQARDFSSNSLERLNETLEFYITESRLAWTPVLEAFNVWENPAYARLIIEGWIENKPLLRDDYLYSGDHINITLVTSLANVPKAVQKELLKTLEDSLRVVDVWIAANNANHAQQIAMKQPSREWQLVQQILLRNEIKHELDKLPSQISAEDLRGVEQVFLRLHRHKVPYTFKTVIDVAKALKKNLAPLLGSTDFVDIFGSFPNLAAKIKVSDIDIMFSPKVDQIYYDLVSQTQAGQPVDRALFNNQQALLFANSVTAAENSTRAILNSQQEIGELFSVNLIARTDSEGNSVRPQTLPQTETWFSMGSPLMIRIYADRIVFRFWDGLTAARDLPAQPREFVLEP